MGQSAERYDVVVIGGGGAGIVAAIAAGRAGARVLLCEKMPKLGKKVRISGNGRCNLTHEVVDASGYNPEAKDIVEPVFSRFSPEATLKFFKDLGLRVYAQEDGRVFPVTNQSASVLDLLEMELSRVGAEVIYDADVVSLKKTGSVFTVGTRSGLEVLARHPVLCAGGKSYPVSGTDGSAYALAVAFGHTLVQPVPSTVPLLSEDPWCRHLTGQRIKAGVRAVVDGRPAGRTEGDLLFTDYGLSGLTVLDVSEEPSIAMNRRGSKDVRLDVDLLPFLHEDELRKELSSRLRRKYPDAMLLAGLLPPKFSHVLETVLRTRNPATIAEAVKHKSFAITGTRGWNDAEFTAGGIDHREVDPLTLESKKCPGLYLAGEILDVDGKRGGFNLAWAWSSGYVAGQEAARVGRSSGA